MPLLPLIPILTTAGRFTLPYLQRELVKQGTKKFLKDHGKEAFTAVTGGVILNSVMDDKQDSSIVESVAETPDGLVIGGEPKETLPPPPPLITPEAEKVDTKLETPIDQEIKSEPFITPTAEKIDTTLTTPIGDTPKKEDFILTKNKAEQQVLPLEEEGSKQIEYYSKIVKGIENFNQPIATKDQLKNYIKNLQPAKSEIEFLGINDIIDSYPDKVDVSKFLDKVKQKDISSTIRAEVIPHDMKYRYGNTHYDIYASYSLDGPEANKDIVLIKADLPDDMETYYATEHFSPVISKGAFAHFRAQYEYGQFDSDSPKITLEEKNIINNLKETYILDEIQSDWLQHLNKVGTLNEIKLVKGKDLTKEFLDSYKDVYSNLKDIYNDTDYAEDNPILHKEIDRLKGEISLQGKESFVNRLADLEKIYVFNKKGYVTTAKNKKEAIGKVAARTGTNKPIAMPDFPIQKTDAWVDKTIEAFIKRAVEQDAKNIAFTNGAIHVNRYDGLPEEKALGLKNFYDNIVKKKFEKIAKKYNLDIQEIKLKTRPDVEFLKTYKEIENNQGVLTTLTSTEFVNALKKSITLGPGDIPDFYTIKILQKVTSAQAERALGEQETIVTNLSKQGLINHLQTQASLEKAESEYRGMAENQYMVWVKSALNEDTGKYEPTVMFELPAVQIKLANESKPGGKYYSEKSALSADSIRGTELVNNIKNKTTLKNIDLYDAAILQFEINDPRINEKIFKMPIPEELKKDIAKPKKMVRVNQQTDKLIA
jgi:hypothetical protein